MIGWQKSAWLTILWTVVGRFLFEYKVFLVGNTMEWASVSNGKFSDNLEYLEVFLEWWKNHSAICFFTLFPCFLMKYAVGLEIGNGTVLLTNAQCHDGTHISRPAHLVYCSISRKTSTLRLFFKKGRECSLYYSILLFSELPLPFTTSR